jgi:hypothetical protein
VSSPEARNLEVIVKAIDQHDTNCDYPALAVAMNPFEAERLGWDTIKGLPIRPDPELGTGMFRVLCSGDEDGSGVEEEEAVEAVAEQESPLVVPAAPGRQ